jgi:hypothetical protein
MSCGNYRGIGPPERRTIADAARELEMNGQQVAIAAQVAPSASAEGSVARAGERFGHGGDPFLGTMGANKVDYRAGEPSLFGGPGEVVRSQRLTRIRKVSGRITGDQGIQEGADESSVAATVTLQSLGHVEGRDRDPLPSTSAEVEQVEHLAVALDAPVGAE